MPYNQLHLNDSTLPLSLFPFHESLEKNVDPDVSVKSRAWYDVPSTGNQAGASMEYLANAQKEEFSLAHPVLTRSRYVNDVLPGGDSLKDVAEQIHQMNQARSTTIPRYAIPVSIELGYSIRLQTATNAASDSCRCTIFAGVGSSDCSHSSNLVYPRSKTVHETPLRNKLDGAVLGAEASLTVQQTVGTVALVHYFTGPRTVVCWALNTAKKLGVWAFTQVQALHNMFRRVVNKQEVLSPHHISSTENPTDLLTQPKAITEVELLSDSVWHKGPDWIRLPAAGLPAVQFTTIPPDLEEPCNQVIFQKGIVSAVDVGQEERDVLVAMTGQDPESLPQEDPQLNVVTSQPHPTMCSSSTFKLMSLGWEIITPNRLKLGHNNNRQLEGPTKLDNCPQIQLKRNRLLTQYWYEIFINRTSLFIPPLEHRTNVHPQAGDVVLFRFTGPNFKKLWIRKPGVLEEKLSRSAHKIRYSGPDGVRRYVERAAIIVPVNQLST